LANNPPTEPPSISTCPVLTHQVQISLKDYQSFSLQLLPLDSHHIAVVAEPVSSPSPSISKTVQTTIQIFTRKGRILGTLALPVQVGSLVQTPIAHQFITVDRQNPSTAFLIDLKPYRISRLGINIEPHHWLATAWGYLFASHNQIVALDREGRSVGQLQTYLPITAIALASHDLFVATWQNQQGYLNTVDLRDANLDLLF
jgi:serine/threonine-protein kinase